MKEGRQKREIRQTHIKLIKHTSIKNEKNPQRHHRKRGPNGTHEVGAGARAGAGAVEHPQSVARDNQSKAIKAKRFSY